MVFRASRAVTAPVARTTVGRAGKLGFIGLGPSNFTGLLKPPGSCHDSCKTVLLAHALNSQSRKGLDEV